MVPNLCMWQKDMVGSICKLHTSCFLIGYRFVLDPTNKNSNQLCGLMSCLCLTTTFKCTYFQICSRVSAPAMLMTFCCERSLISVPNSDQTYIHDSQTFEWPFSEVCDQSARAPLSFWTVWCLCANIILHKLVVSQNQVLCLSCFCCFWKKIFVRKRFVPLSFGLFSAGPAYNLVSRSTKKTGWGIAASWPWKVRQITFLILHMPWNRPDICVDIERNSGKAANSLCHLHTQILLGQCHSWMYWNHATHPYNTLMQHWETFPFACSAK